MFYRYAYTEVILTLTADEPLGVLRALDGTLDAVTLDGPTVLRTVLMTPLTREEWRGYADLTTMPDGAYVVTGVAADYLGNEATFGLAFELRTDLIIGPVILRPEFQQGSTEIQSLSLEIILRGATVDMTAFVIKPEFQQGSVEMTVYRPDVQLQKSEVVLVPNIRTSEFTDHSPQFGLVSNS